MNITSLPFASKMSDNYAINCLYFEDEIRVAEPEIRYTSKKYERKIVCTLEIPYSLLNKWHGIVQGNIEVVSSRKKSNQQENPEDSTSSMPTSPSMVDQGKSVSYVDLIEYCIPGGFFVFTGDENIRNKVDASLSKIAGGIAQLYKKTRGRARIDLDTEVRKFHVFEGETKSIKEFCVEIKSVRDELNEWKKKYINLEEEKEKMYKEMVVALKEKDKVIADLQNNNKELEEYADNLAKAVGISSYVGKRVSEAKNKNRTLKTFLSKANMALWFSSSFGLQLESLVVKEHGTGHVHNMKCHQESFNAEPTCSSDESGETSSFSTLPLEEKNKIEQILFLLDKFCVGDSVYHELSMIVGGLPR